MRQWLKALFEMVREYRTRPKGVRAAIRRGDGHYEFFTLPRAHGIFELPTFTAKVWKENEAPELPRVELFELVALYDGYAVYEPRKGA